MYFSFQLTVYCRGQAALYVTKHMQLATQCTLKQVKSLVNVYRSNHPNQPKCLTNIQCVILSNTAVTNQQLLYQRVKNVIILLRIGSLRSSSNPLLILIYYYYTTGLVMDVKLGQFQCMTNSCHVLVDCMVQMMQQQRVVTLI